MKLARKKAQLKDRARKQHVFPELNRMNTSSTSTSEHMPARNEIRDSRYFYTLVHSSVTHNRQKVELIQCLLMDEHINKL